MYSDDLDDVDAIDDSRVYNEDDVRRGRRQRRIMCAGFGRPEKSEGVPIQMNRTREERILGPLDLNK